MNAPLPDQIRAELARLKLTGAEAAELLGVARPTVWRWLQGRCPMPTAAWRLLQREPTKESEHAD